MDWEAFLPEAIRSRAFFAGNELAWSRQDALAVIDLLSDAGLMILGVDIWGVGEDGPWISPFVYDLDLSGEAVDSASRRARIFVQSFQWDEVDPIKDRAPFFNFTVDSSRSAAH